MPGEPQAQIIQDCFPAPLCRERSAVAFYLTGAGKLPRQTKSFDNDSIIPETENHQQLLFKHALSTLVAKKSSPDRVTER